MSEHLAMLKALVCMPWAQIHVMAATLRISEDECRERLDALERDGLAVSVKPNYTSLSLYAPNTAGIDELSEQIGRTANDIRNYTQLSRTRYWQLRAAQGLLRNVYQMLYATTCDEVERNPTHRVVWQALPRRMTGGQTIHARLSVLTPGPMRGWIASPVYLLVDNSASVRADTLYPCILALRNWAESASNTFYPILIVTHSPIRAAAFLEQARRTNMEKLIHVTSQLDYVRTHGLRQCTWQSLDADYKGEDIFTMCAKDVAKFSHTVHAIPDPVEFDVPRGVARLAMSSLEPDAEYSPLTVLTEQLDRDALLTANFLATRPVWDAEVARKHLQFTTEQFERITAILTQHDALNRYGDALALTTSAQHAMHRHSGRAPGDMIARYDSHVSQRIHQMEHTRLAHEFPVLVAQQARAVMEGLQPPWPKNIQIHMAGAQDEFICRTPTECLQVKGQDVFQEWAPDGYFEMRIDDLVTAAFYEVDGTARSPSKASLDRWSVKLEAYVAFYKSTVPELLFGVTPSLLIITHVGSDRTLGERIELIRRVLSRTWSHSDTVQYRSKPQLLVTSAERVTRYGPLARIWVDVNSANYGFDHSQHLHSRLTELGIETQLSQYPVA